MLLHTLLVVCLSFVVSCVGQSRTAFSVSSVRGERGRWQHCSAYCPTMDVLVIVGGLDSSFQNSETSDSVLVHSFSDDSWHSFDDVKEYPKDVRTCEVGVVSDDGKTCALGLMFGSVTRPTMEVIGLTVGKVTSKDSSTFTVNTEAVVSTSLVAQLPASRILFCSTFLNGVFYMYGGFSVKDGQFSVQYRSPWKLSLSTSDSRITGAEWDEVKVLSDTVDALDSTPPPLYSCSLTAAMHDDSVNLFLYGGESANSGDYSYYESLWQLDTNSSMWEQTNPTIPLRRLHHNTVYYQGSLFVLGGLVPMSGELRPRSHFFSTTILQSNVFSENRQASCLPEGKPSKRENDASLVHDHSIGIWCQYDGNSVGNYPTRGYAGSSCTLRRNELVCSFGASDRSGDSISNQIVTIDLNRISEHLEVAEQDVAGTSIFSTFYFFFGLLGVTTALVCMLGARDRHRSNGRRLNQPPEPRARNRGASATLVATIPEITFSASDGNNPDSEQSEQNLCPICISDYEEGDKLRVLPCTHRFHTACIDRWLEKDKACPMCKQDIDCDLESAPRAHGGEASEQMNQRVAEPSFLARRPMNPWQQNPLQSQESNNESSNGSRPTAVEMTVV